MQETGLIKSDPNLAVIMGDLFGPGLKEASQKPVSDVMSPIRVKVEGGDPIAKAIFLMIKENVGLMPVMQDSKVAGMITLSSGATLDFIAKLTPAERAQLADRIRARASWGRKK